MTTVSYANLVELVEKEVAELKAKLPPGCPLRFSHDRRQWVCPEAALELVADLVKRRVMVRFPMLTAEQLYAVTAPIDAMFCAPPPHKGTVQDMPAEVHEQLLQLALAEAVDRMFAAHPHILPTPRRRGFLQYVLCLPDTQARLADPARDGERFLRHVMQVCANMS